MCLITSSLLLVSFATRSLWLSLWTGTAQMTMTFLYNNINLSISLTYVVCPWIGSMLGLRISSWLSKFLTNAMLWFHERVLDVRLENLSEFAIEHDLLLFYQVTSWFSLIWSGKIVTHPYISLHKSGHNITVLLIMNL